MQSIPPCFILPIPNSDIYILFNGKRGQQLWSNDSMYIAKANDAICSCVYIYRIEMYTDIPIDIYYRTIHFNRPHYVYMDTMYLRD